jgi:vacuolar-type H+-ATPase subunit H
MVDSDRLANVGTALRTSIPADIQEAQEILTQKDSMINQAALEARRVKNAAELEAQAITASAQQEHEARVDETEIVKSAETKAEQTNQEALQEAQEIVQDAQRRAYSVLDEAEVKVASRKEGGDRYARETLFDLEERLSALIAQVRKGIDALGLEVETGVEAKIA